MPTNPYQSPEEVDADDHPPPPIGVDQIGRVFAMIVLIVFGLITSAFIAMIIRYVLCFPNFG